MIGLPKLNFKKRQKIFLKKIFSFKRLKETLFNRLFKALNSR